MMNTALQTAVATAPVHFVREPAIGPRGTAASVPTQCSTCHLRELCLPSGLSGTDVERHDGLKLARSRLR